MRLLGWWRERSQAARFDYAVRASFYVNVAALPVLAALAIAPELGVAMWVVLPLVTVQVVLWILVVRAGLDSYLGRRPPPRTLALAVTAFTVVLMVAAYLAHPEPTPGEQDGPAAGVLITLGVCLVAALSTAVRPLVTTVAGALICAAWYAVADAQGNPAVGAIIAYGIAMAAVAIAGRVSTWMLGVVWELDRARHVQASLAVAEERLRFARDLHDVVGRTLSVIALKSELAAQLARRGRETAIDEMLEVRQVAQDSLAELRAVVGGYRAADLGSELAGARSLLASAGIECRMIGDGSGLPPAAQGTLGWAVREGTTNVLRHSDARTCTITLRSPSAGTVTLVMENDGVREGPAPADGRVRFGSGLVGLAERLAALSGTVTAERHDTERFRLSVTLPLDGVAPPAAPGVAPTFSQGTVSDAVQGAASGAPSGAVSGVGPGVVSDAASGAGPGGASGAAPGAPPGARLGRGGLA